MRTPQMYSKVLQPKYETLDYRGSNTLYVLYTIYTHGICIEYNVLYIIICMYNVYVCFHNSGLEEYTVAMR